jgi:endonuclease III
LPASILAPPVGVQLSQEEAFALLTLCLMSQYEGDKDAESALRKLADYCKQSFLSSNNDRGEH